MKRIAHIVTLTALGALALLALPTGAGADSQPVSGTVLPSLGMSVSGPVVLSNFAPGQTATGSGTITVTSTGPWVLRLADGDVTVPGHLRRTTGTGGASSLAQALGWSTAPTLGGTGGSGTLSGTAQVGASGNLSDVVNVSYSQQIGATEQLVAGNVYGLTVTWTISST